MLLCNTGQLSRVPCAKKTIILDVLALDTPLSLGSTPGYKMSKNEIVKSNLVAKATAQPLAARRLWSSQKMPSGAAFAATNPQSLPSSRRMRTEAGSKLCGMANGNSDVGWGVLAHRELKSASRVDLQRPVREAPSGKTQVGCGKGSGSLSPGPLFLFTPRERLINNSEIERLNDS